MSVTDTQAPQSEAGHDAPAGAGGSGGSSVVWWVLGAAVLLVPMLAVILVWGYMAMVTQAQSQQKASSGTLTGALAATNTQVPAALIPIFNAAGATCPQIPATLLAAQVKQESAYNPRAVSPVGAEGIAQFMPATWATWGVDGDGDGRKDVFDPADAIPAQARFMCSLVASLQPLIDAGKVHGNVQLLALAAYNAGLGSITRYGGVPPYAETQAYGPAILASAQSLGAVLVGGAASGADGQASGTYAGVIEVLRAKVGTPYAWGGGGVDGPSTGFGPGANTVGWDCSSFVQYGFYQATGGKVRLPRTTGAQALALQGDAVPASAIQPGDLLFYGGIATASHVALYLGDGQMIEEPHTGAAARVTALRTDFTLAARVPLT